MCKEEVLFCTQKIMLLLIDMHKSGILSIEALHDHATYKVRYLEDCSMVPELSTYTKNSIKILDCYRNILAENSVLYKTPE